MSGAPKFKRGKVLQKREWSEEDMAEFDARLEACEDFCGEVNDYLHDQPDEETPEEKAVRDIIIKKFLPGGV